MKNYNVYVTDMYGVTHIYGYPMTKQEAQRTAERTRKRIRKEKVWIKGKTRVFIKKRNSRKRKKKW